MGKALTVAGAIPCGMFHVKPCGKHREQNDMNLKALRAAESIAQAERWNTTYPPHTLVRVTNGPHKGQYARTHGPAYVAADLQAVIVLLRWKTAFPLETLHPMEGPYPRPTFRATNQGEPTQ